MSIRLHRPVFTFRVFRHVISIKTKKRKKEERANKYIIIIKQVENQVFLLRDLNYITIYSMKVCGLCQFNLVLLKVPCYAKFLVLDNNLCH